MRPLTALLAMLLTHAALAQDALEPRWRVVYERREGPAVAELRTLDDGSIEGTFMTPTGDDGLLVGRFRDGTLSLTPADTTKTRARYTATLLTDGTLRGTYRWGDGQPQTWTAVASPDAELPDLYSLTQWDDSIEPGSLVFRDLQSVEQTIGDLAPAPAILYVFGSWCHNCADATAYLNTLAEAYPELSIVGIAFESAKDFEGQAEAVRRYIDAKDVRFPVLIAGQRDKQDATRVLRALDRVRAYPTFAFVDAGGGVAAVHQGFIGPAAVEAHATLTESFHQQIQALLAPGKVPDHDTP
ncbi:MAG: TlpA disulfide reductase family protein [Planctomycetota bacterium]